MSFIGIVASQRQVNEIKRKISKTNKEKESKENNIEIIGINAKSIENILNIKFETIIIMDSIKMLYEKKEYIRKIISKAEYLIINSDLEIEKDLLSDIEIKTITYGLKQKSTITASSIKENSIIICVQREIKSIKNDTIEPKEIKIKVENNKNIYEILVIYSIIILYNDQISVNFLENFNFFLKN